MPELNYLITIGLVMILLGLFLVVFWTITRSVQQSTKSEDNISSAEKKKERIKGGGVVMIGPLPVVFGTDKKYAIIAMILAIVLMLLYIAFLKYGPVGN